MMAVVVFPFYMANNCDWLHLATNGYLSSPIVCYFDATIRNVGVGLLAKLMPSEFIPNKNKEKEEVSELMHKSVEQAILFFKHSTRCSISSMALNRFETDWNIEAPCDIYFLDLLNHRDISDEIARLTGVVHQSPQAIVVKNGKVIYSATHSSISAIEIAKILA